MKVSTEELRRAAVALLRHLENSDQREFKIAEDFYLDVPAEKRYLRPALRRLVGGFTHS